MKEHNPLFLPIGSVRAILVIALTGGVMIQCMKGNEVSNSLMEVWATAFGLYFGTRNKSS